MAVQWKEGRLAQKQSSVTRKGTVAGEVYPRSGSLPSRLLVLPVVHTTLFPGMVVPLVLPEGKLSRLIDRAIAQEDSLVLVAVRRDGSVGVSGSSLGGREFEEPATPPALKKEHVSLDRKGSGSYYPYAIVAKIIKKINLPDNQVSVLLNGLNRCSIDSVVIDKTFERATVSYFEDVMERGVELDALSRSAVQQFKAISKENPLISDEVKVALVNIEGPGRLVDFMASVLVREIADYQNFLAIPDVRSRFQHLLLLLRREQEVQDVQRKISDEINQKVSSVQREFYLQEQLKYIEKELGKSGDEHDRVVDRFRKRMDAKKLTPEATTRIEEEIEKLNHLHEQSSEYSVAINYLDWATSLPWGELSKDSADLRHAKRILDADHYGLKEVKHRILEFLAVRKLKANSEGTILCLVGPPGTGKTSLGKSIASTLGRKFFRFSVGGMRDEAEIKGHRRTYVGAMPGKIVQGLKRAGVQNPVFLIDEIDKLGNWAHGGDPASALLEVLDPEQNSEFLDHYLDIPFDCSKVFFITTANSLDGIPPALLDRMEVIPVHGYTDVEKRTIARRYLVPKQLKKAALKPSAFNLTDRGLNGLIHHYARESGVRNLEKQISRICRKVAYRRAFGQLSKVKIDTEKDLHKYLGLPPYAKEVGPKKKRAGVATGLAWTQYGGEVLFVESLSVPGKGGLVTTGQLGGVMKESANLAYSWVRDRARFLNLSEDFFEENQIHLHVPAGATPKDGPSAGVTMVASLYSLLSGKALPPDTAMTGEITLSGDILPVGGIKEKVLAAKRTHVTRILVPKENERDLAQLDAELRKGVQFVRVATLDEALRRMF